MTYSSLMLSVGISETSPAGEQTRTTLSCVMTSAGSQMRSGKGIKETERPMASLTLGSLDPAEDLVTLNTKTQTLEVLTPAQNSHWKTLRRVALPNSFCQTLQALMNSEILHSSCTVSVSILSGSLAITLKQKRWSTGTCEWVLALPVTFKQLMNNEVG